MQHLLRKAQLAGLLSLHGRSDVANMQIGDQSLVATRSPLASEQLNSQQLYVGFCHAQEQSAMAQHIELLASVWQSLTARLLRVA